MSFSPRAVIPPASRPADSAPRAAVRLAPLLAPFPELSPSVESTVRRPAATRQVLLAATTMPAAALAGMVRYSREHDWHLVTDPLLTGALPLAWGGDGVLAYLPYQGEALAGLRRTGVPCVALGGADPAGAGPQVAFDNEAIGRLAADHFLERAHRSFAWAPLLDDEANAHRHAAFAAQLARHGRLCRDLPPIYHRTGARWQETSGDRRAALGAELRQLPHPAAVFAYNDCVAGEIVDACRHTGLAVPDDIAVLGVGDSIACSVSPVPLSTIDLDFEAAGHAAAAMLDLLMAGEPVRPGAPLRPRGVVTRVSTDMTAVADPRVARALGFIAENFSDPMLCVGAVAEAVGMSRRQLERRVREKTGGTINDHIIRIRMNEASRLLKTHPRARTADIASFVGLTGPGTFFRNFRRYYGTSPKKHRDPDARLAPQASAASTAGASSATALPCLPVLGASSTAA